MTQRTPGVAAAGDSGAGSVRTLARGLVLLELVAARPDGIGVSDLALQAGLDKGTTSRLLVALRERGYVRQRPGDRRYVLTGKLLTLSQGFVGQLDLRAAARPHLEVLRERTHETVHLAVLEGLTVVYIDQLQPDREVRASSAVGTSLPLHVTAMGRAVLGAFAEPSRTQLTGESRLDTAHDHMVDDLDRLSDTIEAAARRRWATVSRRDEVSRVASAVMDVSGRPVGAISVSGPAYRMNGDLSWAGELCRDIAQLISADLGATPASR